MKRLLIAALALSCLALGFFALSRPGDGSAQPLPRPPKGFFGIGPQAPLTEADAEYMAAGGIESIRLPVIWSGIQPTAKGGYHWEALDESILIAARHGLTVLPFLVSTPRWVARKPTTLPVNGIKARQAWATFLEAAVRRYGPGGEFWAEHAPGLASAAPPVPRPLPIRAWQIWNEANFFYFAYPASPQRYAKLLKLSSPAIKRIDPGAKVILTGLFGEPTTHGARGMPATRFLEALYRVPGIESYFDGIALHPYAYDSEALEELVEALHEVTVENHDRVPLYITEMGWGSQNDYNVDAFEQGPYGQVKELRAAYRYLLKNRNRLDIQQVDWFSWKDLPGSCDFCDSVGFFHDSPRFNPKPAWHAFVSLTGGKIKP